ncbi:MAG: caspase family protein [Cyanobacteria bacterium CRU_2_1]|nr:caspase family protein [Cyanobacteria bacterium CRU_2_1]
MARSLSLHIGVNEVDASTYGAIPKLRSAVKDAEDMKKIAEDLQYESSIPLQDKDATARNVLEQLGRMAQEIQPGGVALISYAGHGSQVPDTTGDESSGRDQTWVLYDRMLLDDELFAMWKRFAPGVRIYFISDNCHSGSVARFPDIVEYVRKNKPQFMQGSRDFGITEADLPGDRLLPPEAALTAFEKFEAQITATQWTCGTRDFSNLTATVVSFAACQDEETAGDGANNGVFTAALKQIWNNGQFNGNCEQFLQQISRKVGLYQRPRFEWFGASNASMLQQKPFAIEPISTRVAWGGGEFGGLGESKDFDKGGWRSSTLGLETFEEPLIRCRLEIPATVTSTISPERFDASLKSQIIDALSKAYRQAHAGTIASGVVMPSVSRGFSGGFEVECKSSGKDVECSGKIGGKWSS